MAEPIDPARLAARRVYPDAVDPTSLRKSASVQPSVEGKGFSEVLTESIGEVQKLQNEADTTIRQLVSGEIKDVTEAMIAVEKADVAFQTLMGVRNKIVAAYEEVMRTQI